MPPYKFQFTGMEKTGARPVCGDRQDENWDKKCGGPALPIRRQLSEKQTGPSPEKAPARTKKNELEV